MKWKKSDFKSKPTTSLAEKITSSAEIENQVKALSRDLELLKTNRGLQYYNIPCAFDIETTSFYRNTKTGECKHTLLKSERNNKNWIKQATMYLFQIGINHQVFYGRTWEELLYFLELVKKYFKIGEKKRLIFYVHNLAFEFQFIKELFEWNKVFALDDRKPCYVVTSDFIEFRCSYILSGYSLAKVAEHLTRYKAQKMVGDLDYSLLRHSKTELTDTELNYAIQDVVVVMNYIQEKIEDDGGIINIPLTKTGYVRKYCKKMCLSGTGTKKGDKHKSYNYHQLMKRLTLTVNEYQMLKRAFMGGFTHANAFWSGKTLKNVASYDFTSSYPAVMIMERFPMNRGEEVEINTAEEFEYNISHYCCIFNVEFINLEASVLCENYISSSRCLEKRRYIENNGRIVSAEMLRITITEQDFSIIKHMYTWDKMRVGTCIRYRKGYLPTDFVKSILELYKNKTILKGVKGKEVEYMSSKEMVNSCYGMCVTDIAKDESGYLDTIGWYREPVDLEKAIKKYNYNHSRILSYVWGVYVTAYARRNLFTAILNIGDDYVYSDTDSVKILNYEQHQEYFKAYNNNVEKKLKLAMKHHDLPFDYVAPKTIKGVTKMLGVWDFEGVYDKFKTLGAKRYIYKQGDEFSVTVAGVGKKQAGKYMIEKFGSKVFENFTDRLLIPEENTGKQTHTYLDEEQCGSLTDYKGITANYLEYSSVHLDKAEYRLTLSEMYLEYLLSFRQD